MKHSCLRVVLKETNKFFTFSDRERKEEGGGRVAVRGRKMLMWDHRLGLGGV